METFTLRDHEDNYAPPEQPCLTVGVVGDVVFLTIEKIDEDGKGERRERLHTIGVYGNDLLRGLRAAVENGNDHQARRAANHA